MNNYCILHTGPINKKTGYGYLIIEGQQIQAHRKAWEEVNGPIPKGMFIKHSCTNKHCINPNHLYVTVSAGPINPLPVEVVKDIYTSNQPLWVLEEAYGLGRTTIAQIRRGDRRRDVTYNLERGVVKDFRSNPLVTKKPVK